MLFRFLDNIGIVINQNDSKFGYKSMKILNTIKSIF